MKQCLTSSCGPSLTHPSLGDVAKTGPILVYLSWRATFPLPMAHLCKQMDCASYLSTWQDWHPSLLSLPENKCVRDLRDSRPIPVLAERGKFLSCKRRSLCIRIHHVYLTVIQAYIRYLYELANDPAYMWIWQFGVPCKDCQSSISCRIAQLKIQFSQHQILSEKCQGLSNGIGRFCLGTARGQNWKAQCKPSCWKPTTNSSLHCIQHRRIQFSVPLHSYLLKLTSHESNITMAFLESLSYVIAILIVWTTTTVVYRLFFHPLAKFPGPRLATATYCYEWYYDLCRDGYTFKLKDLHRKYGMILGNISIFANGL